MKKIYILFSIFFIKKNLNIRNVDHIFLNIVFFSDWYVYHCTRCCNKNYLSFVYNMISALFIQYLNGAELIKNDKTIVLF